MITSTDLLKTIEQSRQGISLAELLTHHPDVPRRTAQRWIRQLIDAHKIRASGEGRARRYFSLNQRDTEKGAPSENNDSCQHICRLNRTDHKIRITQ